MNDKPNSNGGSIKGTLKPGVPQMPGAPDLSQPMAHESVLAEQERREAADKAQRAYGRREEDERLVSRDEGFDASRGQRFSNEDWERAAGHTDPERRRAIRAHFEDATLPNLPKKDGWHRCWVSTTHDKDTPQRRTRLGYRFIKYEDVLYDGWTADEYAVKDAQNVFHGCVMWREMIAMETDEDNFIAIMRELHHDQPMEQARGIYDSLDAAGEELRDKGGRTTMAPGMETLRQFTKPPKQFMT